MNVSNHSESEDCKSTKNDSELTELSVRINKAFRKVEKNTELDIFRDILLEYYLERSK